MDAGREREASGAGAGSTLGPSVQGPGEGLPVVDDPAPSPPLRPLGAPTDLLRPGGRVADAEVAAAKARMAANARKVLRIAGLALAAAALLALLFFVVVALLPKPDL